MKIIYHHRTEGDGAEGIHIREMIGAFRSNGNEVKLVSITDRGKGDAPANPRNKPLVLKTKIPPSLYELGEIFYNLAGVMLVSHEIFRNRPDIIYERYSLYNLSAGIAGKIFGIPTILEVNAPLAYERSSEPDERLVFHSWSKWFEREAYRRANGIIVVSTPLREFLVSLGIEKSKVLLLPNGVDDTKFFPKAKNISYLKKYRIEEEKIVIGFSGIFREWHGIDMLIDSFKEVYRMGYPVYLLLVGDGPLKKWIERKIEKEGLEGVSAVTGRHPHAEMPDVVSLFDIAVSPRSTFYASPMKITEYLAMAKAVVAPATDNIRDIIDDGQDGILFNNNSKESLINALVVLLENNNLRDQIRRNARKKVETRLNWRRNAQVVTEWVRNNNWV